ncbi:hypothetical protein CEDDRAFT_03954 [Frankia sp. CeD]|nr:hypothetical protein BMG523Draft_03527 [Frankia sp. BMG5.23]KEZ34703.1 hypothetical protein CEDDRAFT_03954 [Frankia sp. CeD]
MFAPTSDGQPTCAARLLDSLHVGMIVLADRNFGGQPLLEKIAATETDVLVRGTNNRLLPAGEVYRDGSWRSRAGQLDVQVIRCEITTATDAGRRTGYYQLVSTVLDPAIPAADLIRLHHDRRLIETAFLEVKSTILDGRSCGRVPRTVSRRRSTARSRPQPWHLQYRAAHRADPGQPGGQHHR